MKVVPEKVLTCPLRGLGRPSQLTAARVGNIITHTVISARLTLTGGCGKTPSSNLTGSSGSTANHVPTDTGVSSHSIKGGSRECGHCSIDGVSQGTTVDNCNRHTW